MSYAPEKLLREFLLIIVCTVCDRCSVDKDKNEVLLVASLPSYEYLVQKGLRTVINLT